MAADATPSLLYLPDLPAQGAVVRLSGDEAHYVARVCRARAGDRLEATDGSGTRADLVLTEVRGEVVAKVVSAVREERSRRAWVLCGAPEGERGDWVVEKLAELGVERFVPVDCERGAWRRAAARRARWERLAIAAMRQSHRAHRMSVDEPVPLALALEALPGDAVGWLADPAGTPASTVRLEARGTTAGLIGPSGGLSDEERALVSGRGFGRVGFSDARLRTETAALAWAVWWSGQAAGV